MLYKLVYFYHAEPLSLLLSHLLPGAGATDTSKQSIDHLDDTEDKLQACCNQQGGEQPHVEFNHILWKFTPLPHFLVWQVATITGDGEN